MAMTYEEKEAIVKDVLNRIKASSQGVSELETVSSLNGVNSLPAMQGSKVVVAPVSLLSKPATDAAVKAEGAAKEAKEKADYASQKGEDAAKKASVAEKAAEEARKAALEAENVINKYENTAGAALRGATARFSGIVENATIQQLQSTGEGGTVVYVRSSHVFAYFIGDKYYNDWNVQGVPAVDLYMNAARTEILKDKIYLYDGILYVWDNEKGDLVKSSSSGSGSGFYNVTHLHPLENGYYTKETAIAAMKDAEIEDEDKPGTIITFETSAGKWEDYRFEGTGTDSFLVPSAWSRHGGGDAIKKLHVTMGTESKDITPDAEGTGILNIPVVNVDETLTPDGTNPVQGRAVHAAIENIQAGASVLLNTIGEGDDKAFSISLLDKNGEVLSTTESFTGGGGGSIATTKIVLTRITANPTVKLGDTVKLQFTYDQIDTASGNSTGNGAKATVTVTRGAISSSYELDIAAGSTTTLDVTKYIGTGSNTVRIRVVAGSGEEQQVSSISWTVTAILLTLASSFNMAMVIHKGDTVSIPFALTGSGSKTLRMYIDGKDTEDRTIGTSSANGSFSVNTSGLSHGSHSVQLVAELEQADGSLIKSNSIYFDIAVREEGKNTPVFATRFDYPDGTIIKGGSRPYIPVSQYDNYTLVYAAYNPKEIPTTVKVYEDGSLISSASVSFVRTEFQSRAMNAGVVQCNMVCGTGQYVFSLEVSKSDLQITEPTDNMVLKLSATGRSNSDVNREEWRYNDIETVFTGFKWGGDGWMNGALRMTDDARAEVRFQPLAAPESNATGAMAFMIRYKVTNIMDENAEVVRCVDKNGTGFVITTQEAKMVSRGNSMVITKFATDEIYNIGFVAYPKAGAQSTEDEKLNDNMLYLYVNGIMSGSVQRGASDSIYQDFPQYIAMGSDSCTLDVYSMRAYTVYLTDSQMLDAYMMDLGGADELVGKYEENNVLDGNGEISVDSLPDNLPYIIITGQQENGVPTVLQAAVNNNKKTKYDISEALYVDRSNPAMNFRLIGGCISLQGTSSLAYPTKNYRLYIKNANKEAGQIYLGCDAQGIGGVLQADAKYSFRAATSDQKQATPVDCWCFKADYAESSSSHNTGMAKMVHRVLKSAGELTPVQKHVSGDYPYDVRTTVDGFPCMLFYRNTVDDMPQFLGKFNFNNDKSTEAVFGFLDIPGYHDQQWVTDKFGGQNPTECWEFLNNDYEMGMFLDDDFDALDEDGTPHWLKVFEARFPDDDDINAQYEAGTRKPENLMRVVKWVKSTQNDGAKFKAELSDYFDVDYLCDYYMFTEIFGCVDQRVKNMMMAFWYDPDKAKMLAYMIFYDNDTILGVRNDGRLKYNWDLDNDTIDTELTTPEKTVYAYAGHDSVLWKNLREQFPDELGAAYKRLRARMTNELVFNIFDNEQSGKFCERIYNIDALNKYVTPKTKGVEVNQNGQVSTVTYSYLEAMQGSRKAHRHWWLTNRFGLFDARYMTGQYTVTDLTFKGNSAAGATIRAWATRDFYFTFVREAAVLKQSKVSAGAEWSFTYDQMANVGTIFHFYGGEYARKIDLSAWGGFTDLNLPRLPRLEELVMGRSGSTYNLTEIAIGDKLPMLQKLDIRNYVLLPSLDLSECSRLVEVEAGGCSSLATMNFAEGCPLNKLHLPDGYQTLTLRSLPGIKRSGITFDNMQSLTGLWVENCASLDGFALFKEVLERTGSKLKYIRITGLELEGDGSDLKKWYDAGLGGIDASGNTTGSRCKLCGTYKLTKYLNDDIYTQFAERFDELNIRQPQYTMIEFDDSVADDANISNLDNETGYKYGNTYVPSAHITGIMNQRFRCLGKQGIKGTMTIYPLHDEDSNYYADAEQVTGCSPAQLDSSEGDVFVYEPHYWYKGINDYLNGKKYSCFSTNEEMPDRPECTVITYEDIVAAKGIKTGNKIQVGKQNIQSSYVADANYSSMTITVTGYKRVRFPSVLGSSLIGAVFADDSGKVIDSVMVDTLNAKFVDGMYLVAEVPEGATKLHFTTRNSSDFDCVVLSNSDKIEDLEPDWVEHSACLVGCFQAVTIGSQLYSAVNGQTSVASLTQPDMSYYAEQRGLQLIDWEMHKDIANLFFAWYGRRDSQGQCGYGQHSSSRKIGGTVAYGMSDTIGYEEAKRINPNITSSWVDNMFYQYAWYKTQDEYGNPSVVQVNNICCLGYEDIYGNKAEWMGKVSLPNNPASEQYKMVIEMPDGSMRKVKTGTTGGYLTGVVHQKYMDIVCAMTQPGSSTTYYCDEFIPSASTGRVVYRSVNYASAYAGVCRAHCGYDSSSTYASIGSRLAFRGQIVVASSVGAFKALKPYA